MHSHGSLHVFQIVFSMSRKHEGVEPQTRCQLEPGYVFADSLVSQNAEWQNIHKDLTRQINAMRQCIPRHRRVVVDQKPPQKHVIWCSYPYAP